MGYDMFYNLNSPYSETLAALEKAMEYGDKGVEYIVLEPLAYIMTYEFNEGNVSADEVREVYDRIMEISEDRKSTRLNSSHVAISYAVFCLKKKKQI